MPVFTECIATIDFAGSGPLTDICAWDDGRFVVILNSPFKMFNTFHIHFSLVRLLKEEFFVCLFFLIQKNLCYNFTFAVVKPKYLSDWSHHFLQIDGSSMEGGSATKN